MIWFRLLLITQILFNSLVVQFQPPRAPSMASGSDIVAAVNAFRAGYGLPPYQQDGSLVSIGQAQSVYQASIKTLTHTRPNGSGPTVSSENIAEGTPAESADAIVRQWTRDDPHTITLIGFRTGLVGAGAAVGSDGLIYYTLDVINTGKTLTGLTLNALPAGTAVSVNSTPATPAPTEPPIRALLTVTPQADNSVIHTVQYGQTLSGIATAYGLSLKDLLALNPMINANTVIQIGQRLLIHPPATPVPALPTVAASPTALPVTPTPQPSSPPTPTIAPAAVLLSPTETAAPFRPSNYSPSQWLGISIAFLGLLIAFLGRFVLKRRPPPKSG